MDGLLERVSDFLLVAPRSGSGFLLAAGLAQALGGAAGIIQAIGLVAVFGGLIGAAVSALSGRELSRAAACCGVGRGGGSP